MTETVQVLEFRLADTEYCIDIDYIEEVLELGDNDVTSVPNAESHVLGVMDLRGETTTIIDPKKKLGVDHDTEASRIIVLGDVNGSSRKSGWQVDEVTEVSTIDQSDVEDPTESGEFIRGVINKEDEFVIWVEP